MSLREKIAKAFDDRIIPQQAVALSGAPTPEQQDALWFTGRHWHDLSRQDWEEHCDAVFTFTPEAFAFYLPSILSLTAHGRSHLRAADSIIQILDRIPTLAHCDDFLAQRFIGLKTEEYNVIKEWLISLAGQTYVNAENSLDRSYDAVALLQKETARRLAASAALAARESLARMLPEKFPAEPMPDRLFWMGTYPPQGDSQQALQSTFANRRWTDIGIQNWMMLGLSPVVTRDYLEPKTFLYFLPSLLLGAFEDPGYLVYVIDTIIPSGRDRRPKGPWWKEFLDCISVEQRFVLKAILADFHFLFWDSMGAAAQATLEEAETFWSSH